MNEKRNLGRELYIDAIKTVALMLVFALHTQRSLNTGICYNPVLYYAARCGMPLFFMVNGALILRKEEFSKKYYFKKVLNIIKLLAIWSVIMALYSFFIQKNGLIESIKNGIKCGLGHYIIPFWFFYSFIIIYTLMVFAFKTIKRNRFKLLIVLFYFCLLIDVISIIQILRGGYFVQDFIPQFARIWTWLLYFLLGSELVSITTDTLRKKKIQIIVFTSLISILAIAYQYYICQYYLNRINSEYCYDNGIVIIWSALIFLSIRLFANSYFVKGLAKLSVYGFGAFLIHPIILNAFKLTDKINNLYQALFLWIGLITFCWVISFLFNKIPAIKEMFKY